MPKSKEKTPTTAKLNAAKQAIVSPSRPDKSFKPAGTDYSYSADLTVCYGNTAIVSLQRSDGKLAFMVDVHGAFYAQKPGHDGLSIIAISEHKVERTADSEMVKVAPNKDINDKRPVVFFDGAEDDPNKLLKSHVEFYTKYNKPYKGTGYKQKAKVGSVINAGDPHYLDEHVPNDTVADVVIALYADQIGKGVLDDDEMAKSILSQYFSLIDIDEAKDLVLEKYEKKMPGK